MVKRGRPGPLLSGCSRLLRDTVQFTSQLNIFGIRNSYEPTASPGSPKSQGKGPDLRIVVKERVFYVEDHLL
jgi:hypothetical protein